LFEYLLGRRDGSPAFFVIADAFDVPLQCLLKDVNLIRVNDSDDHAKASMRGRFADSASSSAGGRMASPPFRFKTKTVRRPISIGEAAKMLGITPVAVKKRIDTGKILARTLSDKGILVCPESVLGQPCSEKAFERLCARYISVPEACDIVCVTDGMVGRMLADGRLNGFRLNGKCWAVERASAEQNMREYLASPPYRGRRRLLGESRRPVKRPAGRKRA
jgi:hypothetical protein